MTSTATDVLRLAAGLPLLAGHPDFSPDAVALIPDKGVSDHHTIVPIMKAGKANFTVLPVGEYPLFFLICCELLCEVALPHVYEAIAATFEYGGYRSTVNRKRVLIEGWKTFKRLFRASLKEKPEDDIGDEGDLPKPAQGRIFGRMAASIAEHYTTPPEPCTGGMLLSVMEHVGKNDMPEDVKWKGSGAPATRAAIVEKLVSSGSAEYKGGSLVPAKGGIDLITVLPEALTSPPLVAEWEKGLSEITRNAADQRTFMEDIRKVVAGLVNFYSHISENGQELFASQRGPVGLYPRYREQIYEREGNFYCGNRGCNFVLRKNDRFQLFRKKELTKKMAADLLKKSHVKAEGMCSEKKGTTYGATVILDDIGGKYINFRLEFERRKKRANKR